MSTKSKDTKELIYLGGAGAAIGAALTLLELYYTNYGLVRMLHLNISYLDFYLNQNIAVWGFLGNHAMLRLVIIGLWCILLFYPTKAEKTEGPWGHVLKLLLLAGAFYAVPYIGYLPFKEKGFAFFAQTTNIIVSIGLIIPIIRRCLILARYLTLSKGADLSANEKNAEGFQQNETLLENQYSTTLHHKYKYKGEIRNGVVCWINPFRGKLTLGTPGSGKTYVSLEEDMRQFIGKGAAAVIYDYKDPDLTRLVYSYLMDLHNDPVRKEKALQGLRELYQELNDKYNLGIDLNKIKLPDFGYISFKDLTRTQRCNPMKGITSSDEASDYASLLLLALNRNMAEKQGDFFVESAKAYTTLNIYALGMLFNGKYQSLPHLLSLIGREITSIFPVLKLLSIFYPEMRSSFTTFNEAYEQNVLEQLQGQLASARIGLAAINNPLLCFVMTEDDEHPENNVSLDVNNPENPMVFCIGNDPQKDIVLGLASSVYLSKAAKVVNKKGTPVLFGIDELPTVFIKGMDNLIATARSNKVAVSLGFQDFSQLIRDYGNKTADTIIQTCGNVISGSVKGDTAKKLSESFGDKKVLKESKSVNHEGQVTVSYSEQRERKLPQDVIEELSQGTFVGRMMDDFDQEIPHKVFHGKFTINPDWKKVRHKIPVRRNLSKKELYALTIREQIKVTNQVTKMLSEANEVAQVYETIRTKITMLLPPVKVKGGGLEPAEQPVCLQRFVDDPDNREEQSQFYMWLNYAYVLIKNLDMLDLTNDILSFEEKFDLLILDVFKAGEDKIQIVHQYRRFLNVMTLEEVEEKLKTLEDEKASNPEGAHDSMAFEQNKSEDTDTEESEDNFFN